jgi:ribokinase
MENQDFDLVAIGDLATDAFIHLTEVGSKLNKETGEICLKFGEKIPYESVTVVPAVGNSANAAVCASRLGLKSALVSNIGADLHGAEALQALEGNEVDTQWITRHDGLATNYHYVLWYHDDRSILVKHEEYPYILPFDLSKPKWIYLSSLGENSLSYHQEIAKYLAANPEIKLAFQPGTFQIKLGADKLAEIYRQTEVFFCNVGEAQKILGVTDNSNANNVGVKNSDENKTEEIKELLVEINKLGPKIVVITDATKGAYIYDSEESKTYFMPAYPDQKPPIERTGAGDAFATTFVSALALGKTIPEALSWAPINSMSVVQQIGAQAGLLNRDELEKYLGEAGAEYKVKEV